MGDCEWRVHQRDVLIEFQDKCWQKVEPRPGIKPSLSTLTETQTNHRKTVTHALAAETNPFILPSYNQNSEHWLYNDSALCWNSPSLFICLLVKTSSLFDHTSKVTANNGALSKPIHAQGVDSQWWISVSCHCRDTQLPLPPPRYTIKPLPFSGKLINHVFVSAPNHCFVFIFGIDTCLFS